jgi:hypothetical protein
VRAWWGKLGPRQQVGGALATAGASLTAEVLAAELLADCEMRLHRGDPVPCRVVGTEHARVFEAVDLGKPAPQQ